MLFGKKTELIEEWVFKLVKVKSGALNFIATSNTGSGHNAATNSGSTGDFTHLSTPVTTTPATVNEQHTHNKHDSSNNNQNTFTFLNTLSNNAHAVQATPLQYALGLRPYSLVPNDPGKLRDVLHFVAAKAFQALDTFMVDELRSTANDTLYYELSISPNINNSFLCMPAGSTTNGASGVYDLAAATTTGRSQYPQPTLDAPDSPDGITSRSNTNPFSNFSFNVSGNSNNQNIQTQLNNNSNSQDQNAHAPLLYRDDDDINTTSNTGGGDGGLFNSITSVFRLGR